MVHAPGSLPEPESELARAGRNAAEVALIPSADRNAPPGQLLLSAPLARMPVELDVAVPIPEFRVRNLLALAPGQLIESVWGHGEDVPLASGQVQLAWTEFEVIETQLAVRITRLG
jgi:flagellar motor switch/type III secretory pathway protein FliN